VKHRFFIKIFFFALCYIAFFACGDLAGLGGSGGNVSGSVYGKSFNQLSGSADRLGSSFTITITDATEFSCGSQSDTPSSYLLIDISDISDQSSGQSFSANGRVFFNIVENDVADGSAATSGLVTIDSVDDFSISGSIDASGPNGSISGSFSVEVCN